MSKADDELAVCAIVAICCLLLLAFRDMCSTIFHRFANMQDPDRESAFNLLSAFASEHRNIEQESIA
jgi:hypothetical protein